MSSFSEGSKVCDQTELFHRDVQLFQRLGWKKTPFAPLYCLCSLVKDQLICGFILGFLICFFDVFAHSLTMAQSHYCSFILSLDVRQCQSSHFVLPRCCNGYSGPFASPYKLQNQFVDIHKIAFWNLDWECNLIRTRNWKVLTARQYRVTLSMYMECFSVSLVSLLFVLSELCKFSHMGGINILLGL